MPTTYLRKTFADNAATISEETNVEVLLLPDLALDNRMGCVTLQLVRARRLMFSGTYTPRLA